MRSMHQVFHEEADLEQPCGEVAEELEAYFAADADLAAAFGKVLMEAKCATIKQLKCASANSLSTMVHSASMGEGTMGAIGIIVGTLEQPFVWKNDKTVEKRAKGGKQQQAAEERQSRRGPMEDYHLPPSHSMVWMLRTQTS